MTAEWSGTPLAFGLLFGAGLVASAINSVAGGGTLISFPTLLAVGIPPLPANATNAVALWPGSFAGALGFLNQIEATKRHLLPLMVPTVVGSILGSYLLVATDSRTFSGLVPWLVLFATLVLAVQPQIKSWSAKSEPGRHRWFGLALQFAVGVYGGYFGAGMGIMMLAVMALFVDGDLHQMNAIKNWLGLVINLSASVVLLAKGLVWLVPGVALMAGALVGGYAGARLSQRVESERLRWAIVVYGLAMAGYFFWRGGAG